MHTAHVISYMQYLIHTTADAPSLRYFVEHYGRSLHVVSRDTGLNDLLRFFKSGKGHLAVVKDKVNEKQEGETLGIVTLEDVLEDILGLEILDEKDSDLLGARDLALDCAALARSRLKLWDASVEAITLSEDDLKVVVSYVLDHLPAFSALLVQRGKDEAAEMTKLILRNSNVKTYSTLYEPLYEKGKPSTVRG